MFFSKKNAMLFIATIAYGLTACGQTELETNVNQVKKNSLDNFIFVQGGTFTMGDFGTEKNGQYRSLGLNSNTQPHQVTISSFSLSKYKVTWFEYDTFLLATGRPVQEMVNYGKMLKEQSWGGERQPNQQSKEGNEDWSANPYYFENPASVQWQDAKDYCGWLGQQLNLSIDLTTEAQWEYAARSGGYKVLYANVQGDIHNPPTVRVIGDAKQIVSHAVFFAPIGTLSTPNATGFYDMDTNGREWANDWYSETYYTEYPEITDPKGADSGKDKSLRVFGTTFDREPTAPFRFYTFRCAVNSDKPIQ